MIAWSRGWLLGVVLLGLVGCSKGKDKEPVKAAVPAAGVAAFWKWFGAHAAELHAGGLQAAMERTTAELQKVHPGVITEIGDEGETSTLVISADGIKDVFPAVEQIVAARPAS